MMPAETRTSKGPASQAGIEQGVTEGCSPKGVFTRTTLADNQSPPESHGGMLPLFDRTRKTCCRPGESFLHDVVARPLERHDYGLTG